MAEERITLNAEQAAKILHIRKGTLLNWLSENKDGIRDIGRKVGGRWLFFRDDLLTWIDQKRPGKDE